LQQIAKSEVGYVYVTNNLVRTTFGQHAFVLFATMRISEHRSQYEFVTLQLCGLFTYLHDFLPVNTLNWHS
jgi:hypothetical protein